MRQSFQSILAEYKKGTIANTRKSANFFGGMASQGSIAAALSAGILNAVADQAEGQQTAFDNALRKKAQIDNSNSQAVIDYLKEAQANKIITEDQALQISNDLSKRFGALERQAAIDKINADVGFTQANSGLVGEKTNAAEIQNNLDRSFGAKDRAISQQVSNQNISSMKSQDQIAFQQQDRLNKQLSFDQDIALKQEDRAKVNASLNKQILEQKIKDKSVERRLLKAQSALDSIDSIQSLEERKRIQIRKMEEENAKSSFTFDPAKMQKSLDEIRAINNKIDAIKSITESYQ